jgi:hypothetical protein
MNKTNFIQISVLLLLVLALVSPVTAQLGEVGDNPSDFEREVLLLKEQLELTKSQVELLKIQNEKATLERQKFQESLLPAESKPIDGGITLEGERFQPEVMVYRSSQLVAQEVGRRLKLRVSGDVEKIYVVGNQDDFRRLLTLYSFTNLIALDLAHGYIAVLGKEPQAGTSDPLEDLGFDASGGITSGLQIARNVLLNVADIFAIFRQEVTLVGKSINLDESAVIAQVADELNARGLPVHFQSSVLGYLNSDLTRIPRPIIDEPYSQSDLDKITTLNIEEKLFYLVRWKAQSIKSIASLEKQIAPAIKAKANLDSAKAKTKAIEIKITRLTGAELEAAKQELVKAKEKEKSLEAVLVAVQESTAIKQKQGKIAVLLALNKGTDELLKQVLQTQDKADILTAEVIARSIKESRNILLLNVSPVVAGGDTRNLGSLFNSGTVSYSTGVVLEYVLTAADGRLIGSGAIPEITGYQRVHDRPGRFPTQPQDLGREPNEPLIEVREDSYWDNRGYKNSYKADSSKSED